MDGLPTPLLDDILLKIDPQSLAMIRCTSKSLELHTYNQYFQSEYFSRLGSGLLHISSYGSRWLCYQSYKDSKSLRTEHALMECRILGYCSGIFLLFIDGLCVANPFTKKFRFLTHPGSKRFSKNPTHFGLAVDQIDRNTQNFKIVHITKARKGDETTYGFWINNGDSWRYSKSNITCHSSNIGNLMKTPVYLHGSLHWLRNDGSIIAFNPDTEQARLIQIKFPEEVSLKTFFAASDNNVSLILATEEVIFVYVLTNISNDPTWVLVKKIQNGVLDKRWLVGWNIEAYDSKYLVLREDTSKKGYDRVVHVYDLRANEWVVLGNIPKWCDANRDFFQVTPSLSYVVGLDEILAYGDKRISTLSSIIGLIKGLSTEEVEKQIRKRSIEEEEVKEMLAEESSSEEVGKQIRKVSIGEEKKKLVWLENLKFSNVQRSKRSKRRRRVI